LPCECQRVNTGLAISRIIPRHFGHRRNAAKVLARITGASERAAKNWLASRNAPQIEHWVLLLAECTEIAAEFEAIVAFSRATIK
jgi:hypothetical protein